MNVNKPFYIITGSSNNRYIQSLCRYLFNLEYRTETNQYETDLCSIYVNCSLYLPDFNRDEFQQICNYNMHKLEKIICLENLNPGPETLGNDIRILSKIFTPNTLRNRLNLVFTSSDPYIKLAEIRNTALNFVVFYGYLGIQNENGANKRLFVERNVWLLKQHNSQRNELMTISTTRQNLNVPPTENNSEGLFLIVKILIFLFFLIFLVFLVKK